MNGTRKRVSFGSHGSMVETLIIDEMPVTKEQRNFYNQNILQMEQSNKTFGALHSSPLQPHGHPLCNRQPPGSVRPQLPHPGQRELQLQKHSWRQSSSQHHFQGVICIQPFDQTCNFTKEQLLTLIEKHKDFSGAAKFLFRKLCKPDEYLGKSLTGRAPNKSCPAKPAIEDCSRLELMSYTFDFFS